MSVSRTSEAAAAARRARARRAGAPRRRSSSSPIPAFPTGPIEGSDPLVGLPMPRRDAGRISRPSALEPARRASTSPRCNASSRLICARSTITTRILAHHARELAAAYTALEGYFRRVDGRTGPRQFDQYSTQTYNNFSTLQAQFGFCQTAARIAQGGAGHAARASSASSPPARMRELRSSLVPADDTYAFTRMPIQLTPIALGAARLLAPAPPRTARVRARRER